VSPPRRPFPAPEWPDDPAPTPGALAALRARADAARPTGAPTPDATPPDPGHVLAELPRHREGTALRVAVKSYQGTAHYADLRLWRGGWPVTGKGISLRAAELPAVIDALLDAIEEITARKGGR
jgi:hypothetical protein